ncbi:MAG: hypothetical protein NC187_08305 [Candidatus Amulumruptor caecigallinarius]|nr:hypothetical protein [Candidatus Amulumruptor caecigallinarius]MCM1397471.1 hypothetical protein [Candidatus Amulumruptor caecigallinarius]MCM1454322.1 hypothetical protein [bacterium]
MTVSPFTPLFFNLPKADGIESDYIQTFAPTDRILLEVICSSKEPPLAELRDIQSDTAQAITLSIWQINTGVYLHFAELMPPVGIYRVRIEDIGSCALFKVTDDPVELDNTTLIQYSMKNNRQRTDAVFFIDRMQYFFDWRVPGGFKDSNWTFGVESEQFVTAHSDISQLFGLESTQKRFTLGGSMGVPVWFGEMLNRILVCSHVYFDGVKYTRKEANVPELTVQLDGVNSFVFNQTLQQSVNLDPVIEERNRLIMRRTGTTDYRQITTGINRKI